MPPSRKISRKPMANNIGVEKRTTPFHIVAMNAKNWTPLGMAITRLAAEKNDIASTGMPVANMWWTQTPKLMYEMAIRDVTTQRQPAIGRRENTGMLAATMPAAGRHRLYTSAWPENQNSC